MTKTAYLAQLRQALLEMYIWSKDDARLERFMASAETTIRNRQNAWECGGPAATKAWHRIGGEKKLTLKLLRALPD